jgi:transcriptional regulator of aromatic amino acid metabolism
MSAAAIAQRPVTGSICPDCLLHVGAGRGMALRDFLDGLAAPVLAVDDDVAVQCGNKALLSMLGRSAEQIVRKRGGDVFECAYADLPEGCGRTVHCSGCAIRRAVTHTFITGQPVLRHQAYLNRDAATQILQLGVEISTEKAMGVVLLRIDRIGPAHPSSSPDAVH